MGDLNLIPLVETAIHAAVMAGHEILKVYESNDFDIEIKKDNTPVTSADHNANFVIIERLSQTHIPIISEETPKEDFAIRKRWHKVWIIDPLDGTKEFVKHNGEFTVNIALIIDNLPIIGVVYSPITDVLYFGISFDKSYKLSNASKEVKGLSYQDIVDKSTSLPIKGATDHYVILDSRSHQNQGTNSYIKALMEMHPGAEIKSMGSSIKLCMIAEGSANIYPRFSPTCEWDIAAGQAIIEGAGGEVVDFDTAINLSYNKEDFLNPRFVAQIFSNKEKIFHEHCQPISL